MKKLLLINMFALVSVFSFGQIIVNIESPAAVAGSLGFTIAESGGGWTIMPDMTDPLNAVLDTLVFADDGTLGDSLACNPLVNGAAIAGNIAVLYRGACQFGTKALNAQNAGAIGVIIINNIPGAAVGMGPGTDGPSITIPTVMISQADGAMLRDSIIGGIVTAFIGSKSGYYNDDIGTTPADVLRSENASTPRQLARNSSDFYVDMGARVYNYGVNNQTDVVLNATIEFGGSVVYTQSSASMSINTGDTLFIQLPTFSQVAGYAVGYYTVTYSVTMGAVDEFIGDNIINADFQISEDLLSLGQLDTAMAPESGVYFRAVNSGGNSDFTSCVHFRDSIASRLSVEGMWFAASGGLGDSLTGTYMQLFVYEWTDVFTDLNDAAYDNVNLILTEVASGEYDYLSDLQNEFVYSPVLTSIGTQLTLLDNTRYLFCVEVAVDNVFMSYDNDADYTLNRDYYLQPLAPIQADLSWNANGFGAEPLPSTAIKVSGVTAINEKYKAEFTAFPNPAGNLVNFRLGNNIELRSISILDITGNLVKQRALNNNGAGSIALDVSALANGQYIFALTEENGRVSNVKVTIAK
jgi:hypothetical protein